MRVGVLLGKCYRSLAIFIINVFLGIINNIFKINTVYFTMLINIPYIYKQDY